jgi:hypothetical protein
MIPRTLMITVMINNIPTINAAFLRFCLLMRILLFPWYDEMSSEVMSRIIAVIASQRLMSPKIKGNCIFIPFSFLEGIGSFPKKRMPFPV